MPALSDTGMRQLVASKIAERTEIFVLLSGVKNKFTACVALSPSPAPQPSHSAAGLLSPAAARMSAGPARMCMAAKGHSYVKQEVLEETYMLYFAPISIFKRHKNMGTYLFSLFSCSAALCVEVLADSSSFILPACADGGLASLRTASTASVSLHSSATHKSS